jgi:hypothetical protein
MLERVAKRNGVLNTMPKIAAAPGMPIPGSGGGGRPGRA